MKKLALVLGGGGAKSFTHLGIIQVLQDNHIPLDLLVTCSGGSVIGALIAQDIPIQKIKDEFYRTIRRVNWFRISLSKKGFLSQHNIKHILKTLGADIDISKTKIPIKIVATNFNLGELEIFKAGSMKKAVCASVAFPGFYKPVKIKGYVYIDGGILNAIPADIARNEKDHVVVSVNLDGHLSSKVHRHNIFHIIHRSIYIPLIRQRKKVAQENSDVIIEPFKDYEFNMKNWSDMFHFHSKKLMEHFYELGVVEAEQKIDQIKEALR